MNHATASPAILYVTKLYMNYVNRLLKLWLCKHAYMGADKSLAWPNWKKHLKSRHFLSDAEVIAGTDTWLDGQPAEFFWSGLQKFLVAVACFLPGQAKDL